MSALDVAEAHSFSRGAGIRVAIIDTGVDTRHPDLAGRTQLTRNYIDSDDVEFRNDRHGTQVAGLIAASANNGIGIVGVAPDVRLLAYKACWQASASERRTLQFLHARAGAGRCAGREGAGHQSQPGRAQRSAARGADRQGRRGRHHRRRRGVGRSALRLSRQTTGRAGGRRGRGLRQQDGERCPARSGARHRHAGAERPLRFRVRQLAGDGAGHAAWSRCCWRATRSSASTRMRELLEQSTEKHDTTRGPFLSVNACTALARWSRRGLRAE